jgi:hypothetical protein
MSIGNRVALAVLIGIGLAGTTSAATLGVPKASADFAYKYEGDVLPTAAPGLGFTLVDPNGIANDGQTITTNSVGGINYLRIDTDTNATGGDVIGYKITGGAGTAWDPHFLGGFTVELRARVRAGNGSAYGAAVQMRDENSSGLFQFFNNKVAGDLSSVSTADNADAFHTFRIASYSPDDSSAGQIYEVWRDGVSIGSFAQTGEYTGQALQLGDVVSGFYEVNFDVDYLRWDTTGAFAPAVDAVVPEPASIGLLALGGVFALRRRFNR